MNRRLRSTCVPLTAAVLALARVAHADESAADMLHPGTQPVEIKSLPKARAMYVDSQGTPLLSQEGGNAHACVEAYLAGKTQLIEGGRVLRVDQARRVWIAPYDAAHKTIEYFDGKAWAARSVTDLPGGPNRQTDRCEFLDIALQDGAGNVWLADGSETQGWWLHRLAPDGKWSTRFLTERAITHKPKVAPVAQQFIQPTLQIGPDGFLYAAWRTTRSDGGGVGASGFTQFGPTDFEYAYPVGSKPEDYLEQIIPFPDGSVGFIRGDHKPRLEWMNSARTLPPPPNFLDTLARLGNASPKARDDASTELIAMGPRVIAALKAALKKVREQDDDPEIISRIPPILDALNSRSTVEGLFGNRFRFAGWKPLASSESSGNVYIAVTACRDAADPHALATASVLKIDRGGVWSPVDPPTLTVSPDQFQLYEDDAGVRWWLLPRGALYREERGAFTVVATLTDAPPHTLGMIGVDHDGAMYLEVDQTICSVKPK